MRKGIWIGEEDQYLVEEAKRRGLTFSGFAKQAMRTYMEGPGDGGVDPQAIAERVVDELEVRGLVVAQAGCPTGVDDRLKAAANKFLEGG